MPCAAAGPTRKGPTRKGPTRKGPTRKDLSRKGDPVQVPCRIRDFPEADSGTGTLLTDDPPGGAAHQDDQ
ncbi:hypothetical protein GCM10022384_05300 [Streptomyces marokkonensis]|uniref:Uncharacterized protein n=1 Tax=Streptomyces marokkonensis TaxID=324855 RepID=A0ABP7NV66_9ACTN